MGRMILKMLGVFCIAVVMAVTFVGVFAGNAAADELFTGNNGNGDLSRVRIDGDISILSGNPDDDQTTRLLMDPYDVNLQAVDMYNEDVATLYLNPGEVNLGVNGGNDNQAGLSLNSDYASLGVQNPDSLEWHGLQVYQDATVLSGGTNSTSMTLDDNGATFRNDVTGGPARVTGVADGHNNFDAVNFRQLKTAYSGIASVAALAAIPNPVAGKKFILGVGYGNFEGENAIAAGIKANINNISFTAGVGTADDKWTVSAGFGVSF